MDGGSGGDVANAGAVMTDHPEVVRECREDGKGWRVDEKGDWWPCATELGPMLTREEYLAKQREEADAAEGVSTE